MKQKILKIKDCGKISFELIPDNRVHTLGRHPDCQYQITDYKDVSKHHALIKLERGREGGIVYIKDNNSTYGTYVYEKSQNYFKPIKDEGWYPVKDNEIIRFGNKLEMILETIDPVISERLEKQKALSDTANISDLLESDK